MTQALPLSADTVAKACQCPLVRAKRWAPALSQAAATWGVLTPAQLAAWLAQIAHESGRLFYVRELWGPTTAQARYEFRADLGNVNRGDGFRYRGRGLIQVTGRANYRAATAGMRAKIGGCPDFEADPEAMEEPQWAANSAGWYWSSRNLNKLADAGNFVALTRAINGGINGLEDRCALLASAKSALQTA